MLTVRDQVALTSSKPPIVPIGGVYRSTPIAYTDGQGVVASFDSSGNLKVTTNVTLTTTPSAPANVSVGLASALAVAANASRKGLILTSVVGNTAGSQIALSLIGSSAAELNKGIILLPGDSFTMDDDSFSVSQINAISDVAAQTLAIQELT